MSSIRKDELVDLSIFKDSNALSAKDIGSRLERFMTSAISMPWPLYPDDTLEDLAGREDQKNYDSVNCQSCVLSREDINDAWEKGFQEPLEEWSDKLDNGDEDLGVVGEYEIEDFFNVADFDVFDFNIEGYNSTSVHFLGHREGWQEGLNVITEAAAWRLVLDDIVNQIPRYVKMKRLYGGWW
jgi:hypothetical protein